MNTIKSLWLVGLAATALFVGQAFATTCPKNPQGVQTEGSPVCIAPQGLDAPGTGLQDMLNGMTTSGPGIDVYKDQANPSAYWSIGATNSSENAFQFKITANQGNTFGIFDPTDPGNYLQLFSGDAAKGWTATLYNDGNGNYTANLLNTSHDLVAQNTAKFGVTNKFGYYLETPNGTFFFSAPGLNEQGGDTYLNGMPHMVAFAGGNGTYINGSKFLDNEYLLAWEDAKWGSSDLDYNDFVVIVESVHPVPEPAALGMFGLGVLLIGGFAALRRRSCNA